MRDVRIDRDGNLRCWNCGATAFTSRRTGTFWAVVIIGGALTIGILALLAVVFVKPKLQCQVCNEWNRPGHAQPYGGPVRLAHRPQGSAPHDRSNHLPSRRTRT